MSQFIRRKADPSKLQAQLEAVSGNGGFKQDLTEWKLTVDQKTKEGTAVIRFLQPSDLEGMEEWPTFVTISNHFIKRDGKFYVENCTGGTHKNYDGCPVCQWRNAQGWDWSNEADKKAARETGTGINTSYWANIMVIKDPANPDNDGKVFKYKFTNTVLKMIISAQKGDEEVGEAPIVITDFDNGANFLVRSTKKDKFGTLETSKFQAPSQLPGIDTPEVQKVILEGMQDLRTIVAPTQFKPYDELKKKFDKIMGIRGGDEKVARKAEEELDSFAADMADFNEKESAPSKVVDEPLVKSDSDNSETDDLDDLLAGL
ncbi:single stranded DNA-binding protein [Aeromonas phage 65.2]|uniref:Single-stranded DNA-binding protein n=1 Tax=Aeromonas phage 65.2 TaxID=1932896 RepID=A0A219YBQ3_9CAUD|nr:single stranded DNA-binding protein [Aeromonas phage 65.2]